MGGLRVHIVCGACTVLMWLSVAALMVAVLNAFEVYWFTYVYTQCLSLITVLIFLHFFCIFFCVGVPQGYVLFNTLFFFFFYIQCFALLVSQWDGTLMAVNQQNNFASQSQQLLFSWVCTIRMPSWWFSGILLQWIGSNEVFTEVAYSVFEPKRRNISKKSHNMFFKYSLF